MGVLSDSDFCVTRTMARLVMIQSSRDTAMG